MTRKLVGIVASGLDIPMHRLNQLDLAIENLLDRSQQRQVDATMELHSAKPSLTDHLRDHFSRESRKDADAFDACRKIRSDLRHLRSRNPASTGSKHKANRVRTQFCSELRILEVGVGADLDPHHRYRCSES